MSEDRATSVTMLDRLAAGRTDLVFDVVAAGHGVTSVVKDGLSLIRWCARYGDVSAIRHLLSHGESLASLGPNLDLHGAAFHGHWRLAQFLLENGADPNHSMSGTGETPLHAALCKPNRPAYHRVVQVLLMAGADPHRATLHAAETGDFMRDCRTRGETPLHRAAAFAAAPTIQLLLDAGADVRAKDMNGDSPLSWASWHTRPDAVLRMLCFGDFFVHPDRDSTFDHGRGFGVMESDLLGRPLRESGQ